MKVAVSSSGADLSSQLDPRFGRCAYFIIVDLDSMTFEAILNTAVGSAHGAGIQAAHLVASRGVKVVLTGNIGPNAYNALSASKIQIVIDVSGTVGEAVEMFKRGELQPTGRPNVGGHFGMGGRRAGRGRGGRRR